MLRMSLKVNLLTLAILSASIYVPSGSAIAAEPASSAPTETRLAYSAPDPAAQLVEAAARFRRGDVAGLVQSMLPPQQWEDVRQAYELKRLQPFSDSERDEFARKLGELTGPGAIDVLMAELEPKLVKARAQWPGAQLMAFGAMSMAIESPDSQLTDSQRDALRSVTPAVQDWVIQTDFLNATTLRRALELLAGGVQATGISDLEQVRGMPFEVLLDQARSVLEAGKQAALLYGLDLDAVADSLQVDVLDIDGDQAKVRSTVTLFGAPVWVDHELVLIDGRWYGKQIALARTHALQISAATQQDKG